jgi:hypothetical protein
VSLSQSPPPATETFRSSTIRPNGIGAAQRNADRTGKARSADRCLAGGTDNEQDEPEPEGMAKRSDRI